MGCLSPYLLGLYICPLFEVYEIYTYWLILFSMPPLYLALESIVHPATIANKIAKPSTPILM